MADKPTRAFPVVAGQNVYSTGMTLRDYFAGQALAGISATLGSGEVEKLGFGIKRGKFIVGAAYTLADEMIAQREKSND